jgi:hypothetical protein
MCDSQRNPDDVGEAYRMVRSGAPLVPHLCAVHEHGDIGIGKAGAELDSELPLSQIVCRQPSSSSRTPGPRDIPRGLGVLDSAVRVPSEHDLDGEWSVLRAGQLGRILTQSSGAVGTTCDGVTGGQIGHHLVDGEVVLSARLAASCSNGQLARWATAGQ